jgi:ABC-type uncharacterized transport system permease subunit
MDTLYYLIQNTLPVAVPLLLVALGGMFSERSGVINIALEGIMLVGAYLGCLFVYFLQGMGMNPQLLLILAMIIAAVSGLLFSLLLSFAAINMKADQTITGTSLNMMVPAAVLLFSKMFFNSDGVTTSLNFYIRNVPTLGSIPVIGKMFFQNTYITVYIGLLLLVISTIVLYKTKFGLRLRSCGEHPHAADSVGINVYRIRYAVVRCSIAFYNGIIGINLHLIFGSSDHHIRRDNNSFCIIGEG